ncbi:MAG TPA: helix-turn-helix domain-containing protein, partial [Terracidiphilus sp.]|nr:helix-turn-helix domain-containing protein [Terracidiphilus sp.]
IRAEDLLLPIHSEVQPVKAAATASHAAVPPPVNLALDFVIQNHVQYVLDLNRGNKLRAARQLGISRSTLYRILANDSLLPR